MDNTHEGWSMTDRCGTEVSVGVGGGVNYSVVLIIEDRLASLSKDEVMRLVRALGKASRWIRKNDGYLNRHVM